MVFNFLNFSILSQFFLVKMFSKSLLPIYSKKNIQRRLIRNDFRKPLASPLRPILPIFENFQYLKYKVFSGAVFCTQLLWCFSRVVFHMLFTILIFDPTWAFCKGYSPSIVTNFSRFSKTCHSSNIRCFLKRFFAENNFNVVQESFFTRFLEF